MNGIFDGLFAPSADYFRAVTDPSSAPPPNPLLTAEYCGGCAHRRTWHDGGLGSCRFDGCPCSCFYDSLTRSPARSVLPITITPGPSMALRPDNEISLSTGSTRPESAPVSGGGCE